MNSAAVAFPNEGVDAAREQIDPGYQGQGAVAFVLLIAHHVRAGARQRRTIRRGRADRLNSGLLVIGDDGLASLRALRGARRALSPLAPKRDLALDDQELHHA